MTPEWIVSGHLQLKKRVMLTRMKTALSLGTLAIVALLVAGVTYRVIHEEPKPPENRTAVATPPNPGQAAPENSQPTGREKAAPENPQPNGRQMATPASPAPATASREPTTASQEPATASQEPATASRAPAAGSSQAAKPPAPPATAAPAPTMPAESKMSATNRRNVQEALHHLGYYQGPVDGIFGPRTRAAIRRFQSSIGAKRTGYLTAVEASRLVSAS
jgi:cytoskeletal protein RodZ